MTDLIAISDEDREVLKQAARFIEAYEPDSPNAAFLVGQLDGLAGRAPIEEGEK